MACKVFEHIICWHIHKHLEQHDILTSLQHGFGSRRSCETQLLVTLFDLLSLRDTKVQVDVLVLNFSKAFDTVPHDRLLGKLEHYEVSGPILNWINVFLKTREQQVQVGGAISSPTSVDSGVPQGMVLGPLLFLLHINDLPQVVSSQVRPFADDCLLYRGIRCREDQLALQRDLTTLSKWGDTWGMKFNAAKCKIMRISRSQTTHTQFYSLNNQILTEVDQAKYLGVTLSNELSWSPHISNTVSKANSSLGSSDATYAAVLRSSKRQPTSVWWDRSWSTQPPFGTPTCLKTSTPYKNSRGKLPGLWKNDYGRFSSVTSMLHDLGWKDLKVRRRDLRLVLLYKITHGHVAVPAETLKLRKPTRQLRANHKHKYQTLPAEYTELKSFIVHRILYQPALQKLSPLPVLSHNWPNWRVPVPRPLPPSRNTPRQRDTLWQRFFADYRSRSRTRMTQMWYKPMLSYPTVLPIIMVTS